MISILNPSLIPRKMRAVMSRRFPLSKPMRRDVVSAVLIQSPQMVTCRMPLASEPLRKCPRKVVDFVVSFMRARFYLDF